MEADEPIIVRRTQPVEDVAVEYAMDREYIMVSKEDSEQVKQALLDYLNQPKFPKEVFVILADIQEKLAKEIQERPNVFNALRT